MDNLEITYKGEVDEIPYEDFITSLQEEIEDLKKTTYTIDKDKQMLRVCNCSFLNRNMRR